MAVAVIEAENVVSFASRQVVIAGFPGNDVVSALTVDSVLAASSGDDVITMTEIDVIIVGTGTDRERALGIPAIGVNFVVGCAAKQMDWNGARVFYGDRLVPHDARVGERHHVCQR